MTASCVLLVGLSPDLEDDVDAGQWTLQRADTRTGALDHLEGRTGDPGSRDDPVACVVTDADLSSGTGFELAADVAERDPLLPVVVVGAEPASAAADAALGAGVAAYVQYDQADEGGDAAEVWTAISDAVERYRRRLDRARLGPDGPDAGVVLRDGVVAAAQDTVGECLGVESAEDGVLADLATEPDRESVAAAIEDASEAVDRVRFTPAAAPDRTVELGVRRSPADGAVVGTVRDVTREADRLTRLEREAERLDSLLANVPMSIYFKDRQSRHERVSHFLTRTDPEDFVMNQEGKVHPHHEDVLGKTDHDLYAAEFAEQTVADDRRVMEEEEPIVGELEEGTTSLGADQYTSTTKAPRYDEDGNVIGLVGVTTDVTARIEHRQELERQNERLNEFAEVLTHDLRNPLNIAQGYLDVLEDGHDEGAVAEASAALDRIDALVDEIRSFVLQGRTVEEPEPVDLAETAADAWATVDTGEACLEADVDVSIRADPDRLRTLLENLYRNAVEHGTAADEPPGADLTVRIVAVDGGFAVEDDGAGLPEGVGAEVFERGFTAATGGTGFGLAIVRNIAEAHGWTVDAGESDEGGARFSFTDVVWAERTVGTTIS